MNNEQADVSIRISDLCAAFLKKIKAIILLVLVFTLLGGLFGVYRASHAGSRVSEEDLRAAETELVEAKNSVAAAEGALDKLLKLDIPSAEAAVKQAGLQVQRAQSYADNSLYNAMDPLHRGVSRVTLYVESGSPVAVETELPDAELKDSSALAFAKLHPLDTELLDGIRQIMHTDAEPAYLNELVRITNEAGPIVVISVFHEDAEVARQVTDYLLQTLPGRLSGTVDDFRVSVISSFVGYEVDWEMNDRQLEEADKLSKAKTALFTAEQNLETLKNNTRASAEQMIEDNKAVVTEAEESLQKLQERYASAKPTPKNILKKGILFAAVFFVVGLFGACFLVCLDKVLSGKLQDINDVLTRYSFPLIGTLPSKKKRLFDKTIRKLEGEPDSDFETAGKATAQGLFSVIGERKIALVSSAGPELVQEFLPFVGERVPACGDLLRDAEAVKAAKDYEGFVLVEKRGTSRFDLIDAEARRIRSLGKQIEGVILL